MNRLILLSLALTLTTPIVSGQSWITNGLVAFYPFNGTASDATGKGADGTANNVTFVQDRLGMSGAAASFSGDPSSFVSINSTNWHLNPDFTVSVWFNFTADLGFLNPRVVSAAGFEIGTQTTAEQRNVYFNNTGSSSGATVYSSNSVRAGTWHQVSGRSPVDAQCSLNKLTNSTRWHCT